MTNPNIRFFSRTSIEQVEEGTELAPRFDADGLIACITTDASSGEVLMLGYMNDEALQLTIETGEAHYWSRSRQLLWHKGATSGLVQRVEEMRVDDDQDAIWIRVSVAGNGASCHVGYRSCFYRQVPVAAAGSVAGTAAPHKTPASQALVFSEDRKVFDPEQVYAGMPNPTLL